MGTRGTCIVETAVDGLEWRGAEIGWLYRFTHEVGFADPGALGMGKDNGDSVAVGLEG
jgi:hypothetical protein